MARYAIVYWDENVFVDRDAHWFKVYVLRDGESLGIALGVIDGLSWDQHLPPGGDGMALLSNACVRVLARLMRSSIEEGSFRDRWELDAVTIPVSGPEARALAGAGNAEPMFYEQHTVLAEFDH